MIYLTQNLTNGLLGASIRAFLGSLIAIYILLIVAMWKIYTKAGEKGWKFLIPIYNLYILFKIAWKTNIF